MRIASEQQPENRVKCLSTKRCQYGGYKHFTYYLDGYFLYMRNARVLKGKHLPAASMALRERFLLD
jgi:hypothetical protein